MITEQVLTKRVRRMADPFSFSHIIPEVRRADYPASRECLPINEYVGRFVSHEVYGDVMVQVMFSCEGKAPFLINN